MDRTIFPALAMLLSLPLAACTIDVREDDDRKDVDIRTPVADVSVRTNEQQLPDTGLPVYPGATVRREANEPESANVDVGAFGFGVKVAVARFESADGEGPIVAFYKDALSRYGAVTECRGDVDFDGRTGPPVCRPERRSRDLQLVAGTRDDQHIVGVTPRGSGSEFALVHVATRGVD